MYGEAKCCWTLFIVFAMHKSGLISIGFVYDVTSELDSTFLRRSIKCIYITTFIINPKEKELVEKLKVDNVK